MYILYKKKIKNTHIVLLCEAVVHFVIKFCL